MVGTKALCTVRWKVEDINLREAHESSYNMHLGSTKIYCDLKGTFCYKNIKNDIVAFISQCLVCQQVKIEHQILIGAFSLLALLDFEGSIDMCH